MKKLGVIPKAGKYYLEKGEHVIPARKAKRILKNRSRNVSRAARRR